MTLFKSNTVDIDKITQKVCGILKIKEKRWDKEQKEMQRIWIVKKLKKNQKAKDYTKRLLQDCKGLFI